jgi:hypothetical protein
LQPPSSGARLGLGRSMHPALASRIGG